MRPASIPAAVLAGLLACAALPARAQCAFDQSAPNANAVLTETRPEVTIDFTDEFELHEVRVVALADNTARPTDWTRPVAQVRATSFRITEPLPPGKYLIEWNGYLRRHFHADGGSIPFTVAAAGDVPPEPSPAGAPPAGAAPRIGSDPRYPALLGAAAPPPGR